MFNNKALTAFTLSLVLAITTSSCIDDNDPSPKNASQRAALDVYQDVVALQKELRTARDKSSAPSEKLSIEILMSILSSGISYTIGDLYWSPGNDLATLGRAHAVQAELEVAISPSLIVSLPTSLGASAERQLAELIKKVGQLVNSVQKSGSTKTIDLTDGWITFLEKTKLDLSPTASDMATLISSAESCTAGTSTATLVQPLSLLATLNAEYLTVVNQGLNERSVAVDWFARTKSTAARMSALSQLFVEWMKASPLSGCGLPPEPLNEINGGPGSGSCIKQSHGDQAGTSNGLLSSGLLSSGTGTVQSSTVTPPSSSSGGGSSSGGSGSGSGSGPSPCPSVCSDALIPMPTPH